MYAVEEEDDDVVGEGLELTMLWLLLTRSWRKEKQLDRC